jgi:hypothetical protein
VAGTTDQQGIAGWLAIARLYPRARVSLSRRLGTRSRGLFSFALTEPRTPNPQTSSVPSVPSVFSVLSVVQMQTFRPSAFSVASCEIAQQLTRNSPKMPPKIDFVRASLRANSPELVHHHHQIPPRFPDSNETVAGTNPRFCLRLPRYSNADKYKFTCSSEVRGHRPRRPAKLIAHLAPKNSPHLNRSISSQMPTIELFTTASTSKVDRIVGRLPCFLRRHATV